jgi:hypothetical protein
MSDLYSPEDLQRFHDNHLQALRNIPSITVAISYLESIEDRLYFLAEVLHHDPEGLEVHHVKGLAAVLGDIADDVLRLHDPDPFTDARLASGNGTTSPPAPPVRQKPDARRRKATQRGRA